MEIKNLKNFKFEDTFGVYSTTGYALYEKGKGFVSLNGGKSPYTPIGGKSALQSILDAGGFIGEVSYIKPIAL